MNKPLCALPLLGLMACTNPKEDTGGVVLDHTLPALADLLRVLTVPSNDEESSVPLVMSPTMEGVVDSNWVYVEPDLNANAEVNTDWLDALAQGKHELSEVMIYQRIIPDDWDDCGDSGDWIYGLFLTIAPLDSNENEWIDSDVEVFCVQNTEISSWVELSLDAQSVGTGDEENLMKGSAYSRELSTYTNAEDPIQSSLNDLPALGWNFTYQTEDQEGELTGELTEELAASYQDWLLTELRSNTLLQFKTWEEETSGAPVTQGLTRQFTYHYYFGDEGLTL